jgi:SAM-dependent methyltransferase/uncharacterized protein YbaR (Trm112 family)
MWKRFAQMLRCPICKNAVELSVFNQRRPSIAEDHLTLAKNRGLLDDNFACYVEAGVLACHTCAVWFPIFRGLPVLLPYATALGAEFDREYAAEFSKIPYRYGFPSHEPVPGERYVLDSFSTEWLEYDFDGVIWEMDYENHERRFLTELGHYRPASQDCIFLEMGCGIGITTDLAQKNFGVDAVGVDLSLAALSATVRYCANPFLHFVQGSVFYLPFAEESFGTIYSRGVLHHTHSTHEAFRSLVRYCRRGGATYLWIYGPRSIDDNVFRRVVFGAERTLRPILSRRSSGPLSTVILASLALGYMSFNRARRRADASIQPYNFRRALHAARDRFTPEYAHRHDRHEVEAWFHEAGFRDVEVVDWRTMPSADHDDYRRNTGVRGYKT